MGLFNRFFGRPEKDDKRGEALVANPETGSKISLQVLFDSPLSLNEADLRMVLRAWHGDLANAASEFDPKCVARGTPLGLVGWADHVIRVVGFNVPMPKPVLEKCVQPSHYGADLKQRAHAHQAHILLWYAGYTESRLEQFVALAAVAAVLAGFGACVVVNESAHTSFPAAALSGDPKEGDRMELLRTLPLLILYGGFVKYEVEGVRGVWMRTYGLHLLGLPDLAMLTEGHHEGDSTFELFTNVLSYVTESEAKLAAGHTMQVGDDLFLRIRTPHQDEYFLESAGDIFVTELVSANEINR